MMGIEFVRSTAPRPWDSEKESFHQTHRHRSSAAAGDSYGEHDAIVGTHPSSLSAGSSTAVILPHSAPSSLLNASSRGFGTRRAASFPVASAVLIGAAQAVKMCHTQQPQAANDGKLKVRSQSESAALNKLVQLNNNNNNNTQYKPRHFLDEFEIWRNRKSQNGGAQSGTASVGQPPVGTGREVKFFGEPHPLQSDSEGEDSLVSPDEEVSPSGSCAEEEEDEEEHHQHQQHHGTASVGQPMLDVLDEFVGQLDGLDIVGGQQEEEQQQKMAPPLVEPPCSDYVTVPPMLASVDIAMPVEPSPLVQLPFKVPLLSVELCHRRPSIDGVLPPLVQPPSMLINSNNNNNNNNADESSSAAAVPTSVAAALPDIKGGTTAVCPEGDDDNDDIKSGAAASGIVVLLPPAAISCGSGDDIGTSDDETLLLATEAIATALRPLKRVRFADDCGQCLETVRVMTEPSDYPPKISPAVLRRIRRAAAAAASATVGTAADGQPLNNGAASVMTLQEDSDELDEFEAEEERQRNGGGGAFHRRSWKMAFNQPASEYVRFRDSLERQRVALENVMLRNELGRMVGTIKVANIAFEKHVFVRHTSDGWKTFTDTEAQWQCSPSKAFDTFRFDVPLPRNNECSFIRVEFCVRFLAGSSPSVKEHWDSNDGRNFVLLSNDHHHHHQSATTPVAQSLPMAPFSAQFSAHQQQQQSPFSFLASFPPCGTTATTMTAAAAASAHQRLRSVAPTAKSCGDIGTGAAPAQRASSSSSSSPTATALLDINHNGNAKTAVGMGENNGTTTTTQIDVKLWRRQLIF